MDLLGELGATDQLTTLREENKALHARVDVLITELKSLKIEKLLLQGEVEKLQTELASPAIAAARMLSGMDLDGPSSMEIDVETVEGAFLTAGDGIHVVAPSAVALPAPHGDRNPTCGSVHPRDDSLVASGGADGTVLLCRWGAALSPVSGAAEGAVSAGVRIPSDGTPVVCLALAPGSALVAVGGMDGTVRLLSYDMGGFGRPGSHRRYLPEGDGSDLKHSKYVRALTWAPSSTPTSSLLCSTSADGSVRITRVWTRVPAADDENEAPIVCCEAVTSFFLAASVEAVAFVDGGDRIAAYVRGTSVLTYLSLEPPYVAEEVTLNGVDGKKGDDFCSFAVLDLRPSPCGKFLALATDTKRIIVIRTGTFEIVRNLYGHVSDAYGNPKACWSKSGKYIYGTTQEGNEIVTWDVASEKIVQRMVGHTGMVRDIASSYGSDMLMSVSYDKSIRIWLPE